MERRKMFTKGITLMRVLILGIDGYLGWPTAMHLSKHGHEIMGIDNFMKHAIEQEVGTSPLYPVHTMQRRIIKWKEITGKEITFAAVDIARQRQQLYKEIDKFKPDAIVHYAEQPSAPYSMIGAQQAVDTQINNVAGTMNLIFALLHHDKDVHIVKLGTMGEYGTPNIDIEEGWLDVIHNGRTDRVLYPKKPGSWYHASKVHDSHNLELSTRLFKLRVTDLNQGIVYGVGTEDTWLDPVLRTSFHYDDIFGTVINRFVCQAACREPLTIYGGGSQTRGYINIRDTVECIRIAIDNPGDPGDFRVYNQFTEQWSISELASIIGTLFKADSIHIANPRIEQEDHYYNAKHTALEDLGLIPNLLNDDVLKEMHAMAVIYRKNIYIDKLLPSVKWNSR